MKEMDKFGRTLKVYSDRTCTENTQHYVNAKAIEIMKEVDERYGKMESHITKLLEDQKTLNGNINALTEKLTPLERYTMTDLAENLTNLWSAVNFCLASLHKSGGGSEPI